MKFDQPYTVLKSWRNWGWKTAKLQSYKREPLVIHQSWFHSYLPRHLGLISVRVLPLQYLSKG